MAADPVAAPVSAPTGAATDGAAEFAPAKVNLFLHVTGRRPDGYHLLESLAVFPAVGDRLEAEAGPGLSLALAGPFGDCLPADGDNLVLRAAAALARAHGLAGGAALRLEKRLPVASGIGGGSADAAAALRLLARLWRVAVPEGLGLALGADVPVCLVSEPRMMRGIGERLGPAPRLPGLWMVLANPGVAVPTAAVFARLARRDTAPAPAPPAEFSGLAALADWLAACRNDLEEPATACCPAIAEVLAALRPAPLVRMSGSGATCFALHPGRACAEAAAARIARARPGWWVAAAPLAGA